MAVHHQDFWLKLADGLFKILSREGQLLVFYTQLGILLLHHVELVFQSVSASDWFLVSNERVGVQFNDIKIV